MRPSENAIRTLGTALEGHPTAYNAELVSSRLAYVENFCHILVSEKDVGLDGILDRKSNKFFHIIAKKVDASDV